MRVPATQRSMSGGRGRRQKDAENAQQHLRHTHRQQTAQFDDAYMYMYMHVYTCMDVQCIYMFLNER